MDKSADYNPYLPQPASPVKPKARGSLLSKKMFTPVLEKKKAKQSKRKTMKQSTQPEPDQPVANVDEIIKYRTELRTSYEPRPLDQLSLPKVEKRPSHAPKVHEEVEVLDQLEQLDAIDGLGSPKASVEFEAEFVPRPEEGVRLEGIARLPLTNQYAYAPPDDPYYFDYGNPLTNRSSLFSDYDFAPDQEGVPRHPQRSPLKQSSPNKAMRKQHGGVPQYATDPENQVDGDEINRSAKQRFLCREIIEKGYDKDLFSKFLQDRRPSGIGFWEALNIDNWTYDQLDSAVQNFQKAQMNPYEEEKIDPRFVVTRKKPEWEDLEFAVENEDFGRKSHLPKTAEVPLTKEKKKAKTSRFTPLEQRQSPPDKGLGLSGARMNRLQEFHEEQQLRQERGSAATERRMGKRCQTAKKIKTVRDIEMEKEMKAMKQKSNPAWQDDNTLANVFVLQEQAGAAPLKKSARQHDPRSSTGPEQAQKSSEEFSCKRMQQSKLTINREKYIPIDRLTDKNILTSNSRVIKCSILQSKVQEKTEYFVFKSKQLIFQIQTKSKCETVRVNWIVKRFENDFYQLRTLLAISFGQMFIPPLCPTTAETAFTKKSLVNREKSFSRFLRSVTRCSEFVSHPLVEEFLRVDHSKENKKDGMKQFSKKLFDEIQLLQNAQVLQDKMANSVYRISSYLGQISLEEEMVRNSDGKLLQNQNFDEKTFVTTYDTQVSGILQQLSKFQTQTDDLKQQYTLLHSKMQLLSKVYEDQQAKVPQEAIREASKMFSSQGILLNEILGKLHTLIRSHFEYQQHVIVQSVRPFLPKIMMANQRYSEAFEKFLTKRQRIKEDVKESTGIGKLEREVQALNRTPTDAGDRLPFGFRSYSAATQPDVANEGESENEKRIRMKYATELYNLLVDIEKKFLKSESKAADRAESLLQYTKNQFMGEFRRVMNDDESKTLKVQMVRVSKVFYETLNLLNCDWSTFSDTTMQRIIKEEFTQEELDRLEIISPRYFDENREKAMTVAPPDQVERRHFDEDFEDLTDISGEVKRMSRRNESQTYTTPFSLLESIMGVKKKGEPSEQQNEADTEDQ